MPCRDPFEEEDRRRNENSFLTAALCATLTFLEDRFVNPFDYLDYKEAGITRRQLEGWWTEHKRQDELRRKREKEERERKRQERMKLYQELKKEFE